MFVIFLCLEVELGFFYFLLGMYIFTNFYLFKWLITIFACSIETYYCITSPPTVDEIFDTIQMLRNNKAPGEDGLPVEIFKQVLETLVPLLYKIIYRAWVTDTIPQDCLTMPLTGFPLKRLRISQV